MRKSVVVVLGMHRAGTSAVTRGLQVLDVDLGDHLLPPAPNNNEKGFFEDVDVNAINAELYRSLGEGQDWHTLVPVPREHLLHERHAHLRLRAFELLTSRLQGVDCFGLKDPRMCRLLPFWQSVFGRLQVKVSYVISVRNPLSVAKSLEKRNGLAPEKCHYLWLEHVLPSVLLTQGAPRVLVDYDLLMDEPQEQILRVARALGLDDRLDSARLAEFSREFLDDRLRHANFKAEDVYDDPLVPNPVKTAVRIVADVAADKLSLDSEHVARVFGSLSEQMEGMAQAMNYLLRLDNIIEARTQAVHDKDVHINNLDHAVAERDGRIDSLRQAAGAREAQLAALTQELAARDGRIDSLTQAAEARESRLAALTENLAERDGRIEALDRAIKQKEAIIQHVQTTAVQINHRLRQARASLGWRLFWPARMMRGLLARMRRKIGIDLVPLNELQAEGAGWRATGDDPQFLLIAERNWSGLAGWCWLEVDSVAARPMNAQLYFDFGTGFDDSRVIDFQLSGKGSQRIPLYIPSKCHAIRFDPCDAPLRCKLTVPGIRRLKNAPELPPEFLGQFTVYESLGGREGSAAALEPAGGVVPDGGAEYDWRSEGADPRFVVKRASQKLRPGWYMIELRMRSDLGRGNAKLYFDHGRGYSESASVPLPFRSGQIVERLFHLEAIPKQVRFDPVEGVAKFSVERLDLAPVMPMFARNSMLRRLCNHSAGYKNQSIGRVWRDLQAQAKTQQVAAKELLFQRYNETFPAIGPHDAVSYAEWIARVETTELSKLGARAKTRKPFKLQPTVSLVMPVYNTPEGFLRQAIASVLAQSYPRWELCIADDASPEPHVQAVIEEHARRDPRIKLIFRRENGHISAASNSALALATGEYVALMDHDDELAPHALHFVVEGINRNPSAQILYSDEDKIDETGNRAEPHFKPDWNPDLFFSQNYVSHLGVYRRELLQRIGGFRLGVEGSQDHDLLLRCLPHVQPGEIVHIPMVLYHWRILEGSTALGSEEKHYTTDAGVKALQEFFSTGGRPDVKVEAGLVPNAYRVRYPIPQPEPLVSLLIPTRDKLELLEPCVRSILDKTTYQNYEIVILDNGSVESSTLEYFKRIQSEDARVRVVSYPHPFNFSAINNYGVRQARGELVGLVNNDIAVISPEWLTELVSHALRPEIGCVGAKLYYDDETIQHAGVIIGLGGVAGHSHKYFPRAASGYFHRLKLIQNLSAVTAACLVVRKAIYEQVGGLEETALGIAFNDVDFCLKVREAGYRNLWTPYAELYHLESKSRGTEDTPEKVERYNKEVEFIKTKWGEALRRDPCYSPHLTLAREDFSLR